MKIRVDENNYLILNPQLGGRILELKLAGKIIILGHEEGTGNGCYLLYPWVNRIQAMPFQNISNPYSDENGLPLHGLYSDLPRTISVFPISDSSVGVQLVPQKKFEGVPEFIQTYILSQNKLQVKIKIIITPDHKLPVCFGYHPFIQIGDQSIANCTIHTDIKTNIKLDERLLPAYPYEKKDIEIKSSEQYDSLFQGGSFLELSSKGYHVKVSSKLPYWQIYTPPDGKRIAVEPMSFTGNVYVISQKGVSPKVNEGGFEIIVWEQK